MTAPLEKENANFQATCRHGLPSDSPGGKVLPTLTNWPSSIHEDAPCRVRSNGAMRDLLDSGICIERAGAAQHPEWHGSQTRRRRRARSRPGKDGNIFRHSLDRDACKLNCRSETELGTPHSVTDNPANESACWIERTFSHTTFSSQPSQPPCALASPSPSPSTSPCHRR